METDLCINYVVAWGDTPLDKRQEAMMKHLKTMNFIKSDWTELNYGYNIKIKNKKEMITTATELIIDLFDSVQGYRDVDCIKFEWGTIYLSGGMSYGDTPTDSYDTITKFCMLPVELIKVGGFYETNFFDLFMNKFKKDMPKELVTGLEDWRLVKEI